MRRIKSASNLDQTIYNRCTKWFESVIVNDITTEKESITFLSFSIWIDSVLLENIFTLQRERYKMTQNDFRHTAEDISSFEAWKWQGSEKYEETFTSEKCEK